MSGGHFNYEQSQIREIRISIENLIKDNKDDKDHYADDIIEEFKTAVHYLKLAYIYSQRIDWLISGDDGEDSFRRRLKEDFEESDLTTKIISTRSDIFYSRTELLIDMVECCKIGPITNENYCPKCGKKITRNVKDRK